MKFDKIVNTQFGDPDSRDVAQKYYVGFQNLLLKSHEINILFKNNQQNVEFFNKNIEFKILVINHL